MKFGLVALPALLMATQALAAPKTTPTSAFGMIFDLKLKPENVASYTVSYRPDLTVTGSSQCPSIGTPVATLDVVNTDFPPNDVVSFTGTNGQTILDITQDRATFTSTNHDFPGRVITNRQNWLRVRDNPNGIDGVTGIRHYLGTFSEENQRDASGHDVVTGNTKGVISLQEPLTITSGPLAGLANQTSVLQFIGPQAAWLEPFSVSDARSCGYIETGVVAPVQAKYENTCTVSENIVRCP